MTTAHGPSQFAFKPTLAGASITLRPLRTDDFEDMYAAAADPLIWEQHPDPLRYQRAVFESRFFSGGVASGSAFVVLDNQSGKVVGSSRYYDWDPVAREIAIGYTFLARSHWGGAANREMKRLMLEHAFHWAQVVWFHIGVGNLRSRRAIEKMGARFSHEAGKEANGVLQQTAFYRIESA